MCRLDIRGPPCAEVADNFEASLMSMQRPVRSVMIAATALSHTAVLTVSASHVSSPAIQVGCAPVIPPPVTTYRETSWPVL